MNFAFITNMQNPVTRRIVIVLLVACAIPILLGVLLAELIWKTLIAATEIIKTQVNETKPTIANLIDYIKEIW